MLFITTYILFYSHSNSPEVAQFVNLSIPECRAIIERYYDEEEREMFRIREK